MCHQIFGTKTGVCESISTYKDMLIKAICIIERRFDLIWVVDHHKTIRDMGSLYVHSSMGHFWGINTNAWSEVWY